MAEKKITKEHLGKILRTAEDIVNRWRMDLCVRKGLHEYSIRVEFTNDELQTVRGHFAPFMSEVVRLIKDIGMHPNKLHIDVFGNNERYILRGFAKYNYQPIIFIDDNKDN